MIVPLHVAWSVFWLGFYEKLPQILPRWAGAWAATLLVLLTVFGKLRPTLRRPVVKLDDQVRKRAEALRFRGPGPGEGERRWLNLFFRFWTNFASAPCLSVLVLTLAIVAVRSLNGVPGVRPLERGAVVEFDGGHYLALTLFWFPGLAYFGAMLLSWVKKKVFRRVRPPRPHGSFGHKMTDGSFPSGHSLTAFCFWLPVALVVGRQAGAAAGFAMAVVALAVVALTGLSRVYLGVHFPSDVLGGYVIGLSWLCVCYFVLLPVL